MALSAAFVDAHIRDWEARLVGPSFPHRSKWPSRLFHHSPIENIVRILNSGQLLSRNDSVNVRARDVAADGIIGLRQEAHECVRLYFRPRTPTQYHIEGIRRRTECQAGQDAHAPILVMLLLDARHVLTQPGVQFSDRNMQRGDRTVGETEQFFATIPFDKVFHEGGIGTDRSIIAYRCAEVLPVSPFAIRNALHAICCRSNAERDTLLYLLGHQASIWSNQILVSDDLRVFNKMYAFVREVSLSQKGLILSINPRHDGGTIDLTVK